MANPLENVYENANIHTHGGVGTFTKEKKLELMWINSVKKRRRKVIHIVFSTWDQGVEMSPAECPMVPLTPCTEKTGFHRVHRTLVTQ